MGTLSYGDNLGIPRRYLERESVDLVDLDSPLLSARGYSAGEKHGSTTAKPINTVEHPCCAKPSVFLEFRTTAASVLA